MDMKKVVSILLILTVIVAFAFSAVHFFLESNSTYGELHKSRVYEAYLDANDIARKLSSFTYNFYDNIHELDALLRPENSKYNETKERIIYGKCELLRTQAKNSWLDISQDLMNLRRLAYLDKEIPFLTHRPTKQSMESYAKLLGKSSGQHWGKGEKKF